MAPIIGRPWGSIFEVVRNELVPVSKGYEVPSLDPTEIIPDEDNRGMIDDNTAQQLTMEEISAMKKEVRGSDV
jgi:hypothetical protein